MTPEEMERTVRLAITSCRPVAVRMLQAHGVEPTPEEWDSLGEKTCILAYNRIIELARQDASYETVVSELAQLTEVVVKEFLEAQSFSE